MQRAQVRSLAGELRSHVPRSTAKRFSFKKKKKVQKNTKRMFVWVNGTRNTVTECASSVAFVVPSSLQPYDCSLPGSSVHGTSQARILETPISGTGNSASQPEWWVHRYSFFRLYIHCVHAFGCMLFHNWASLVVQLVKNLPAMQYIVNGVAKSWTRRSHLHFHLFHN